MKRVALAALVLLALAGCASQEERPEGIVERWLLALNQGSAGEPDRYAPAEVSDAVLPGWEELDPGEFDTIEVGRATDRSPCDDRVPIRITRTDGDEIEGYAVVQRCPTAGALDIVGVERAAVQPEAFLSEGGRAFGVASSSSWVVAIGIGVMILLAAELLMRFVRSTASD